jgi:hypothetical protein
MIERNFQNSIAPFPSQRFAVKLFHRWPAAETAGVIAFSGADPYIAAISF